MGFGEASGAASFSSREVDVEYSLALLGSAEWLEGDSSLPLPCFWLESKQPLSPCLFVFCFALFVLLFFIFLFLHFILLFLHFILAVAVIVRRPALSGLAVRAPCHR